MCTGMKTQEYRKEELQQRRFEADLAATINSLFRRCPTLCGFSVRDAAELSRDRLALRPASGLFVTEVSVYPMRDLIAPAELCNEIVAALADLIDECPDAGELLRARTFARILH
jgi:hypothetical protein